MKKNFRLFMITLMLILSMSVFMKTTTYAKPILTGDITIDAAVEKLINRASKPKMSNKEKLKATYIYLVKNMHYSHSKGPIRVGVSKKEKDAFRASLIDPETGKKIKVSYSKKFKSDWSNVRTLQGTCKDMSGVLCIVANHLGYQAGYVTGRYVRGNGSTCEHWWNYMIMGGKKYMCDIQAANDSWKRHHSMSSVHGFYAKSPSSSGWKKKHRW